MDWVLTAKLFAALFAIMNPLSTIPVFLALTADATMAERRSAMLGMLTTIVLGSFICALGGQWLLSIFGIDVNHFRLAGGLIVLLIALNMLNGDESSAHHGTDEEKKTYSTATNVGIYPLGIPIAFGPGTMATIIVFAQSVNGAEALVGYYAGLIGYLVFFGVLLAIAPFIANWLSPTALSISKRLMGIILAAIAAEMIAGALGKLFPGWLG